MQEPNSPEDKTIPEELGARARLRQTLVVLGTALLLRGLVVGTVLSRYPQGWLFTRGVEMGLLARSINQGLGLSSPFGPSTGPTAFLAPGYPLLVAGVFRLFGSYSTASAAVIMTAQVGVNLLTVWLILQVARQLAGSRAAWIAGLLWACSLPLIWMPTILWDTSLSACVVLGFVAVGLRLRGRFDGAVASCCGAAVALVGLMNPALIPATGAIVLWMAMQRRGPMRRTAARLLLCGFTFALVFSPWPIRNARVFHAFIPLRTTVGFELWMGNRDGASGYLDESVFPMYNQSELAEYKAEGEVAYTDRKSELAKAYILAHPGTFLEMTARRVGRFWTGSGSQHASPLFSVYGSFTTLLGLIGLGLLVRRRSRVALLFALPLLLFPLPYYITHAEFRYRLVIDPLLTVLSGCAAVWLWERSSRKDLRATPLSHEDREPQVLLA